MGMVLEVCTGESRLICIFYEILPVQDICALHFCQTERFLIFLKINTGLRQGY